MNKSVKFSEVLKEQFVNRSEAIGVLNTTILDEDPRVFLLALRYVAISWKGLDRLAAESKLNQGSVSRMLSLNGNPKWQSLEAVFKALGVKLSVDSLHRDKPVKPSDQLRPSAPYGDWLRNPAEAVNHLNAMLEDDDGGLFFLGLREITEAWGGIALLANKAGLSTGTLYRMLSLEGNPKWQNLHAVLRALGLTLSVKLKEQTRKTRPARRAQSRGRAHYHDTIGNF